MYNVKLYWTLFYFSLCGYWKYINFCFSSFLGIPIGITCSAIGLQICAITAGIKKFKSIIKKKKKKRDKLVLLAKSKWNSIEILTSKTLIDSYVSHDEFALINNVLN